MGALAAEANVRPHEQASSRGKVERFTVTHHGVPIGEVELPEQRRWAGGPLEPLPGFEPLRAILSPIALRGLPQLLLTLERDARLDELRVPPDYRTAFALAAALDFALLDAGGLPVPTELVRVADTGGGSVQVRAYFWRAGAPTGANRRRPDGQAGGFGAPSA
jgi:hypothetical protein